MTPKRPDIVRVLAGLLAVAGTAGYLSVFAGDTASAEPRELAAEEYSPTERDLAFFERRLRKLSRQSEMAKTCGGALLGGTSVHVALQFPDPDERASREQPGLAQAHAPRLSGAPKVLILDSREPTLWKVTGAPAAIVLLGQAVAGDMPESTAVFAPRFVAGCESLEWQRPPENWAENGERALVQAIAEDAPTRLENRAVSVSKRLFAVEPTTWIAQRGPGPFQF